MRLLLAALTVALSLPLVACGSDAEGATNPPPQAAGFTGYQVVERVVQWPDSGDNGCGGGVHACQAQIVSCPTGKTVLGGGWSYTEAQGCNVEGDNAPTPDRTGWQAGGQCWGVGARTEWPVTIYAICADVD